MDSGSFPKHARRVAKASSKHVFWKEEPQLPGLRERDCDRRHGLHTSRDIQVVHRPPSTSQARVRAHSVPLPCSRSLFKATTMQLLDREWRVGRGTSPHPVKSRQKPLVSIRITCGQVLQTLA